MNLKKIWEKIEWQFILWLARRLPDCQYMTAQFSDALEHPPTLRQRATMKLHLYTCEACRRYLKQINLMHESLAKAEPLAENIALSNEARQRIKMALNAADNRQS